MVGCKKMMPTKKMESPFQEFYPMESERRVRTTGGKWALQFSLLRKSERQTWWNASF
jgi:hypothetical protein